MLESPMAKFDVFSTPDFSTTVASILSTWAAGAAAAPALLLGMEWHFWPGDGSYSRGSCRACAQGKGFAPWGGGSRRGSECACQQVPAPPSAFNQWPSHCPPGPCPALPAQAALPAWLPAVCRVFLTAPSRSAAACAARQGGHAHAGRRPPRYEPGGHVVTVTRGRACHAVPPSVRRLATVASRASRTWKGARCRDSACLSDMTASWCYCRAAARSPLTGRSEAYYGQRCQENWIEDRGSSVVGVGLPVVVDTGQPHHPAARAAVANRMLGSRPSYVRSIIGTGTRRGGPCWWMRVLTITQTTQ